jgi:ABC-type uncharacterized transport system YnjBCD substrate-binding protein
MQPPYELEYIRDMLQDSADLALQEDNFGPLYRWIYELTGYIYQEGKEMTLVAKEKQDG